MKYKEPPLNCKLHTDTKTLRMLDELNKMTADELAQFDSMTEVREECLRRSRLDKSLTSQE